MEPAARDLSFRARGRRELSLTVFLRVQDADTPRVRYARATLSAQGEISGTTVDLSEGGLGVIVDTYMPKWCRVWVRIPSPVEGRPPLLAIAGAIHRCVMCDRRPAYLLGIGFHDLSTPELGSIRALLAASDDALEHSEALC